MSCSRPSDACGAMAALDVQGAPVAVAWPVAVLAVALLSPILMLTAERGNACNLQVLDDENRQNAMHGGF